MVNYYIYAKDYSYSTCGIEYYHDKGLKTVYEFKDDLYKINCEVTDRTESQIIYLHWGHKCEEVDYATTVSSYKNRDGSGEDTLPETIISWIKQNINEDGIIKLLYIITDGLINNRSMHKCLRLNQNVVYENVVFHGINQDLDCIDLSVAASFFTSHCIIYRNNELIDDTNISEEFKYDSITIKNFLTEIDELKSYIRLKYINTSKKNAAALIEIDKLKKLRGKLFSELSSQVTNTQIDTNLNTKDKNAFLSEFMNTSWYKNLDTPSQNMKMYIDKSISTLINYIVTEKKSYVFDALKFQTKFSYEVADEPIVDINFTTDQEIEFPDIILDDEKGIPVILCTELNLLDKIIFQTSTASFAKFNSTMECPLFLLNDPDLNDSIGYFYTLNVYKQLLEKTNKVEPRTRRPFHGGLVLVDTDDFDKYNDYILSATYFNFKKVKYNVGLFYFVLWKICDSKQWMDKNVVEQFKKYMLRRISTTVCRIGLSSLPLDPQVTTLLPAALWYCVELSSHIFKDDPNHFRCERLRMYYGIAHYMIEILKYFQYNLDLEFIEKRIELIRHVMILKKIPSMRAKVFYLVEKIFKTINGFLVCEIEHPANIIKLNYLKLNHKEILGDDITKESVNLSDYVHFLHSIDDSGVQICKTTFRPFFMIDENISFYSKMCKNAKNVVITNFNSEIVLKYDALVKLEFGSVLSYYNLFLCWVKKYKKFPTLIEYMEYILKKKKFKTDLVTIFPVDVCKGAERAFLSYESVIKGVCVSEFIGVCDKYVNRVDRIKAENKGKFETDHEIQQFISMEELNYLDNKVSAPKVDTQPEVDMFLYEWQ